MFDFDVISGPSFPGGLAKNADKPTAKQGETALGAESKDAPLRSVKTGSDEAPSSQDDLVSSS